MKKEKVEEIDFFFYLFFSHKIILLDKGITKTTCINQKIDEELKK